MRRLFIKKFTLDKQGYLLTIDTDGLKLIYKCYLGGSEKNEQIKIKSGTPISSKIWDLLKEEGQSNLAYNLKEPGRIALETRNYNRIPYPESKKLMSLREDLANGGLLEVSLKDADDFKDYLSYNKIKFAILPMEENILFFGSADKVREYEESINDNIRKLKNEIKVLEDLNNKVWYLVGDFK